MKLKKQILFIVFLFFTCFAFSQAKLVRYRYWFDARLNDTVSVAIPASFNYDLVTAIDANSLPDGLHFLSIQFMDEAQHFSSVQNSYFYKTLSPVTGYEYWIDNNYSGKVSGNTGPSANTNLTLPIQLDNTAPGYHSFNIRFKNASNTWTTVQSSYFIKLGSSSAGELITGYRYWFDENGGTITSVSLQDPVSILLLNDSLSLLAQIGHHKINIQFQSSSGLWSTTYSSEFLNCPGILGPIKADFDFAINGYDASFVNNSKNAAAYSWQFGSGTEDTSSMANPLFRFPHTPGFYNVRLIASNDCTSTADTIYKPLTIRGIREVKSNRGGNQGAVTVSIYGGGFSGGMQVKLQKQGQPDIMADTILIVDAGEMKVSFNLSGATIGLWNLVAKYPGNEADTLFQSFLVETPIDSNLFVRITGESILRIGFNQVYTITYGNSGNMDAQLVPLLISGLPLGTDIEVLDSIYRLDTLQLYQGLNNYFDSIPKTIHDTANNISFRLLYIRSIKAGSTNVLNVVFHLPERNELLHTYPLIRVVLGRPIKQNTGSLRNQAINRASLSSYGECLQSALNVASEAISAYNPGISWVNCLTGIGGILESEIGLIMDISKKEEKKQVYYDAADVTVGSLKTLLDCAEAGTTVIFPEASFAALLAERMLPVLSAGLLEHDLINNCSEAFKKDDETTQQPIVGNAVDPNEKYGIGDSSALHYTNTRKLAYMIGFENENTANLNAQTVVIKDTLNSTKFDLQSFGFTSVTIGDSTFLLSSPVKSFYHDFDFTANYGVKARVTAIYDSSNGIARWTFFTIDPNTNQVTASSLNGFLPPNVNPPKGQGHVSYVINAKTNLVTADSLSNRASIYFDYNKPITTDTWVNTFDFIKPASSIQPLPENVHSEKFIVSWSGNDNLSGINRFDVYVATNDSSFRLWRSDMSATSDTFSGLMNSKYSFYSIAYDNAGNKESQKTAGESTTTVRAYGDSLCAGTTIKIISSLRDPGAIYQWQEKRDTGYINIYDMGIYSGTGSDTLVLTNVPSSYCGYRYRCVVSINNISKYSYEHELRIANTWLGIINSAWENPNNWSCGIIPDVNTDVIIKPALFEPVLGSNRSCKSIRQFNGTHLKIASGASLLISGKMIQ